jgi:zinc protease
VLAATMMLSPTVALSAQRATAASGTPGVRIPFEKYTLPNGLSVVLAEEHSTPTVAVLVNYHVGSKNEQTGRTGFAHLFEHVMFTGSGHVAYGLHDKFTEGVGGGNNGTTSNDRTVYYETVPSNYLEHALWLESDRMGWLLDALDTGKYNAQRDIVKNERRQGIDNQPYGRSDELIAAAMYPKAHPYSWPVIGSMADLAAASVEDVKQFFRLNYAPNNATLVLTGDFDRSAAKAWIAKYFGEVPRGKAIVRPTAAPVVLAAEKRLVYEDRVQVPKLYLRWPVIGVHSDDQYPLALASDILTGARTARLTKELVYDRQLATEVSTFNETNESVGNFHIEITPRPGHSLTELEAAADSIIERFKREGPTVDELKRAKAGLQFSFVSALESNLGKAFRLANGQMYFGDPGHDFTVSYIRYQTVSAADVKRVVNKYLGGGRVVLSIVPVGKKDQASKPEKSTTVSDRSKGATSAVGTK